MWLADYEARIATLERLVAKVALENEFLKGVSRHGRQSGEAQAGVRYCRAVAQAFDCNDRQ